MLFNELYGKYYHILFRLLTLSYEGPLDEQTIKEIIAQEGYDESLLHLYPKLTDETTTDFYQLLKASDEGGYESAVFYKPERHLTLLEKQWLKSMMQDVRCNLFFADRQKEAIMESLKGVEPLYPRDAYRYIGQAADGDDYNSEAYRKVFRQVLCCIQKGTLMQVDYLNRYGRKRKGYFAPYRLEYTVKDDKFRLNVVRIDRGKMIDYSRLNLARIRRITQIPEAKIPEGFDEFILGHKVAEPALIELTNIRNGFDRCFVHLSNYERRAEYDETTGKCHVKIYYYDFEETELLVTLMSYGPILKVIGPTAFRQQYVQRLKSQLAFDCK